MATILQSDKTLDGIALCINEDVRQLAFEGVTRSSKTVTAIEGFFWRMYLSKSNRHLMASYTSNTLNDNLLYADGFGIIPRFKEYFIPNKAGDYLKRDKLGNYYLEFNGGKNGIKKIALCTYGNKIKWRNILGGTYECVFIDEANIADPNFINECYARQTSFEKPFTLYTLNGDIPTASIYEHINKSKPIGKVPASILADMNKAEKVNGYYYTHWVMSDNPIMTPEKIARASELYPVGSFYYTTKILGERGTPNKAIYVDYINESEVLKKLRLEDYHSFIISADIGATRAQNSITLTGYTPNYTEVCIYDNESFSQCGYNEKTKRLIEFIEKWQRLGARNIECVTVDSAEQNYIKDLQGEFIRRNLPSVIPSYKATIKERIDLNILLFSRGRLKINDTENGRKVLDAFKQASWVAGKEGIERKDENEPWNDKLDSVEYGETRHLNALLKATRVII